MTTGRINQVSISPASKTWLHTGKGEGEGAEPSGRLLHVIAQREKALLPSIHPSINQSLAHTATADVQTASVAEFTQHHTADCVEQRSPQLRGELVQVAELRIPHCVEVLRTSKGLALPREERERERERERGGERTPSSPPPPPHTHSLWLRLPLQVHTSSCTAKTFKRRHGRNNVKPASACCESSRRSTPLDSSPCIWAMHGDRLHGHLAGRVRDSRLEEKHGLPPRDACLVGWTQCHRLRRVSGTPPLIARRAIPTTGCGWL